MKQLNDEGLGYQMITIAVGFVAASIVLIVVQPLMQFFVGIANGMIGGTVYMSAQTMGTFGFIVGIFSLSPIIIIIGFLAGAWLEAVYEKDTAGGGYL